MHSSRRPFLLFAMLLAIGLRTVFGAPCCMEVGLAPEAAPMVAHGEHDAHDADSGTAGPHGGHGDDPSANPCCSACGPTLPSEPTTFANRTAPRTLPAPAPIRALATRPPFPAYEATGPPLRV